MAMWKAHKLAGEARDGLYLTLGQRVRAIADLDGVPAGTKGKVNLTGGFQWLRYRVLFDNGVELGFLDDRHIEPLPKRFGR
jgi:hypothetical protein